MVGRAEPAQMVREQAALRRVATLVARGVPADDLFAVVTEQVGRLLGADLAGMIRFQEDETVVAVATWAAAGAHPDVSGRWSLRGDRIARSLSQSGLPTREDAWDEVDGPIAAFLRERLGVRSSVGSPVTVEGRVWGALFVHSTCVRRLPPDTEERLANFTELVATAIANAQARSELQQLAHEQAALRRVATLVARQSSPAETLTSIAREVATLLEVDVAAILRYEPDQTVTVVAGWGHPKVDAYVGRRLPADGDSPTARVRRTSRPARRDDWSDSAGDLAALNREAGVTCSVAAPVIVDAQLWGTVSVSTTGPSPLPVDTEARIAQFTELVATAISNVKTRSDLTESRARIVHTADRTRQRFERDLHDGVQQRLVSVALDLRGIEAALPADLRGPRSRLSDAVERLTGALDDLRDLSQGLHPAVLSRGGLGPALRALARRSSVPVRLNLDVDRRLPEEIEVTAYFVVSELLANAAKHADASVLEVRATARADALELAVDDDGKGGADPARGTGLSGLIDRIDAVGGTLAISSPPDKGTSLQVRLPLRAG